MCVCLIFTWEFVTIFFLVATIATLISVFLFFSFSFWWWCIIYCLTLLFCHLFLMTFVWKKNNSSTFIVTYTKHKQQQQLHNSNFIHNDSFEFDVCRNKILAIVSCNGGFFLVFSLVWLCGDDHTSNHYNISQKLTQFYYTKWQIVIAEQRNSRKQQKNNNKWFSPWQKERDG